MSKVFWRHFVQQGIRNDIQNHQESHSGKHLAVYDVFMHFFKPLSSITYVNKLHGNYITHIVVENIIL